MSALEVFGFDGADVRVVVIEGKPMFVGRDVAAALGYADTTNALKQHCRGVAIHHPIEDRSGRSQLVRVIGESDLLRLIARSRLPQAERFERWAFDEVLPEVVRTGSYAPALSEDEIVHQALAITARRVEALAAQVAELEPRAEAWDELADAGTDYAVRDAAQILNRAGIQTGPQRLFDTLGELRWIYRGEKHRWTAYARAVDAGYIRARAMPPYVNGDGELVPAAPQIRLTARGLERLRVLLGSLDLATV
ncbi:MULTISPECIES: phage antirepressor KilAC domain-containing protein [unclassified Microbacterium]|uniref:phage antirepressor KilAC domain-containing protein n=1 Tax=unclassified Microbacterium TaxID=2609290 RepID=UPI00365578A5